MTTTGSRIDPWQTRTARIADVRAEIPGVATYRLTCDNDSNPPDYSFLPGQFNMLYLPGTGESAISMSGDPRRTDGWIHTVRVAGNVTRQLAKQSLGSTIGLRGPFGAGWPIEQLNGSDTIIVAGGLGIAPLRPLIYHLVNRRSSFGNLWLIYGTRTPDTFLYSSELIEWRRQGIEVLTTVDRPAPGWSGPIGVVTLIVDRLQLPHPENVNMLACGPEVMMKYVAASGLRLGISPERIWLSLERNMQCAAGFCGHCQLGPEFLCKDGPVLRYDRIRPYLFVEQL